MSAIMERTNMSLGQWQRFLNRCMEHGAKMEDCEDYVKLTHVNSPGEDITAILTSEGKVEVTAPLGLISRC